MFAVGGSPIAMLPRHEGHDSLDLLYHYFLYQLGSVFKYGKTSLINAVAVEDMPTRLCLPHLLIHLVDSQAKHTAGVSVHGNLG